VLGPTYEALRSELSPHELVLAPRSRDGVLDAVARAEVIVGDWSHSVGLDAEVLGRARRCPVVLQPAAGTDGIDLEHAAALDVFAVEPLPVDSGLRGRPNVLLSPHLAGSTYEARERMVASALHNLDRVLRGGAPEHVINGVSGVPRRRDRA
jgi:phosphoglycerate dehydrogenase-like enzyme